MRGCFKKFVFECDETIWRYILMRSHIKSIFRMGRTCKEFKRIVDELAATLICAGKFTKGVLQNSTELASFLEHMELCKMSITPEGSGRRSWFNEEFYEFDEQEFAEKMLMFATTNNATVSVRVHEPIGTVRSCSKALERFEDFFKRVKLILYHGILDIKKDEMMYLRLELKISCCFGDFTPFEWPQNWGILPSTFKCEFYLWRYCPTCKQSFYKEYERFTTKRSAYCTPCFMKGCVDILTKYGFQQEGKRIYKFTDTIKVHVAFGDDSFSAWLEDYFDPKDFEKEILLKLKI